MIALPRGPVFLGVEGVALLGTVEREREDVAVALDEESRI